MNKFKKNQNIKSKEKKQIKRNESFKNVRAVLNDANESFIEFFFKLLEGPKYEKEK